MSDHHTPHPEAVATVRRLLRRALDARDPLSRTVRVRRARAVFEDLRPALTAHAAWQQQTQRLARTSTALAQLQRRLPEEEATPAQRQALQRRARDLTTHAPAGPLTFDPHPPPASTAHPSPGTEPLTPETAERLAQALVTDGSLTAGEVRAVLQPTRRLRDALLEGLTVRAPLPHRLARPVWRAQLLTWDHAYVARWSLRHGDERVELTVLRCTRIDGAAHLSDATIRWAADRLVLEGPDGRCVLRAADAILQHPTRPGMPPSPLPPGGDRASVASLAWHLARARHAPHDPRLTAAAEARLGLLTPTLTPDVARALAQRLDAARSHPAWGRALQHAVGDAPVPDDLDPDWIRFLADLHTTGNAAGALGRMAFPPPLDAQAAAAAQRWLEDHHDALVATAAAHLLQPDGSWSRQAWAAAGGAEGPADRLLTTLRAEAEADVATLKAAPAARVSWDHRLEDPPAGSLGTITLAGSTTGYQVDRWLHAWGVRALRLSAHFSHPRVAIRLSDDGTHLRLDLSQDDEEAYILCETVTVQDPDPSAPRSEPPPHPDPSPWLDLLDQDRIPDAPPAPGSPRRSARPPALRRRRRRDRARRRQRPAAPGHARHRHPRGRRAHGPRRPPGLRRHGASRPRPGRRHHPPHHPRPPRRSHRGAHRRRGGRDRRRTEWPRGRGPHSGSRAPPRAAPPPPP